MFRNFLLVSLFIIIPFCIFTYRLEKNPPGFFIDEAINGYEAYSLLQTGGYSSNGEFLPRFFLNPGEKIRNHHLFIYIITPFLYILGLKEFAVRLPSVFFSIGLLYLIYLLLNRRVSKKSIYIAAFFWSVTSWVFLTSRIGMEFTASAFFFTLVIYLIDYIYRKEVNLWNAIILSLVLDILFFIYAPGKIIAPILMIFGYFLLRRKKYSGKIKLVYVLLNILIILLSLSYFIDSSFFYRSQELNKCGSLIFICLLRNLLSHFNPILFFGNTYIPWDYGVLTHSITGTSLLLLVTFPFWLVGFSYFCYEKTRENFFRLLIIFSLFVSIIPASLTLRGFDSYRSVYLLPIYYIFIIYGIDVTLKIVKIYTIDKKFILAVILSIIMAWEMFFLYSYELNVKAADDSNWQYGVRDIFRNLSDYYDKYERIFLTTRIAFLPNLYLRFYDPKNTYNKIETRAIDSCYEGNMLYVIRPDEAVGRNIDIKKIIYYPNGHDEAYYFVEFERSKLR